jgi:predicted site-specific integrase-resolvase
MKTFPLIAFKSSTFNLEIMSFEGYYSGKQASNILRVNQQTLRVWAENGDIEIFRSKGGKRFYNVERYLKENGLEKILEEPQDIEKIKICYARISTHKQKDDLKRQKEELRGLYPKHIMIDDIGSGLNMNKKGLLKIIDLAIEGKVEELVILYKDRLVRFGFELIEYIIEKYSGGKIIIVHKREDETLEEELVKDVIQIMNVYSAKMNGMRKYKKLDTSDNA